MHKCICCCVSQVRYVIHSTSTKMIKAHLYITIVVDSMMPIYGVIGNNGGDVSGYFSINRRIPLILSVHLERSSNHTK